MDTLATARTITAAQHNDGAIPWSTGGTLDPWNHVEAAMGLDTVGLHNPAAAAYRWLARHQNPDGSWYAQYDRDREHDLARDANFTAYVAVGVHHHFHSTQDESFLRELWPTVDTALRFVLTLQQPDGTVRWRLDSTGTPSPDALLAGSASIHRSLLCAAALARHLGEPAGHWQHAARTLRTAITHTPHRFLPKPHAMDWYYPVLAAAVTADAARDRLRRDWDRFVVPSAGVRCVDHEPWVTSAETAETALTLAVTGHRPAAIRLLDTLERLRAPDGGYWTGYNYHTDTIWPRDKTTWTAAAVLLAHAAIHDHHPTLATFTTPTSAADANDT